MKGRSFVKSTQFEIYEGQIVEAASDVGMTGPSNSVIGVETDVVVEKFLTQMPKRFNTAKGKGIFSAVVIDIDDKSGTASAIQRILLTYP